jgi:tetratricopeptide (TPR) repeat protein
MKYLRMSLVFALGVLVGVVVLAKKTFDTSIFIGKPNTEAAEGLLQVAKEQAGRGSWENLAVARVYYLMGEKDKGQAIIDSVSAGKMDEEDWMRVGQIYREAKEWEKAADAFEKALAKDPDDGENLAKVGAYYNLHGDRAHAEELFARAFAAKPDKIWVTAGVAASYAGVEPQI